MVLLAWGACAALSCVAVPVDTPGSVLDSCLSAGSRAQELQAMDSAQFASTRPSSAAIPPELHQVLARLHRFARLPAGVQVRLVAVDAARDAWVLNSGILFASTKLWTGPDRLDADEIAAVLAHELAHLELSDPRQRLCEAVALSGDAQLPLSAATRALHHAIWAGDSALAVRVMRSNHLRELRADRRGAEMLAAAGFRPDAMARMLMKVMRGPGDYSGSHPALEHRLENLGHQLR